MWGHIDDGSCPGQGVGVRTRLENGLSGFILTRNLSDKMVNTPEERVKVYTTHSLSELASIILFQPIGWDDNSLSYHKS